MKNKFGIKLDRNGYAPSILQTEHECFLTGNPCNITRHEVFFGNDHRKKSKEYGCWIYLTPELHTQSNECVHRNAILDRNLKIMAQERFERLYGHDKFMEIFGKNYLEVKSGK